VDIKVALNRCHPLKSFVYGTSRFHDSKEGIINVDVRPRKGSKATCSGCTRRGPTYDTARAPRSFQFVPLWGYVVFLWYFMRRVDCRRCGVTVELLPWADGKNRTCNAFRLFLARWARRLPWSETAQIFCTNWGVVYRAVRWVVDWGLAHRVLDGVKAIGVDEIAVWTGHKYLTVVYQIDQGLRRLLWVGRERTEKSFRAFFQTFGVERAKKLAFVASDMWKPYLNVVAEFAGQAIHVLDRFHIVAKVNKAVDEVRASEARQLAREGYQPILKHTRWCFLKRRENLTATQHDKLRDVLRYDLRSVRAYLLKVSLDAFWQYTSSAWAGWFLDTWCTRALRSRLEPMKKIARTLRGHRDLILNWFIAKKEISSGAVEGMNTNAKLAIRKARGFRTYKVLETALYHELGRLPEPAFLTHRFC
jgi:transposase